MTLAEKFSRLKASVAGNREKTEFEFTFGMTKQELGRITGMTRWNERIIAELEYALHLSQANDNAFAGVVEEAVDLLTRRLSEEGALTDQACGQAERVLKPMAELARSYTLILTGHAHIDMNWMWSYQETVAATLATFRTMCDIMDQYPDFTFTQSQASVYRIVEQYDPELMARMKKYIDSGRWEVAATSWVEPDKNMPSGESLIRHIEYTRNYLRDVWGVKKFDLDFVPDTFGHALTIPEIDTFGGVKYMYHCRGNSREQYLYRYRAQSGREIMVLKEANWYNSAITPQIASGLMDVVRRSGGLKVGMIVYGVGDHGGGPTRRDIERALDMTQWPIYPTIRFGGLRDYFALAESVRGQLPVVTDEMNFAFPGCYTTQSRIKRGNRRAEAALYDAEALGTLAGAKAGFALNKPQVELAWRDVLFTHFHDIITGSCVQDSREHAMGLYQGVAAVTNTQQEKAMTAVSKAIDTAHMPVVADSADWESAAAVAFDSQSEGAGVGYGIEHFTGVPVAERGSGKMRLFHVFNTLAQPRFGVAEITVWDYTGDLRRLRVQDDQGNDLPFQLLDRDYVRYWDHQYVRILVGVTVPALGYATAALRQKDAESYPVYLIDNGHNSGYYDDQVLDNGLIRAVIDGASGRLKSLTDLATGKNLLADGQEAGLEFLHTETRTSNAWNIGRTIRAIPVNHCTELVRAEQGDLRQSVKATFQMEGGCRVPSKAEVTYSLPSDSKALKIGLTIDWQEQGGDTIPVLTYKTPLADACDDFRCIIPDGSVIRKPMNNDVPGIGGTAALLGGQALALISDCKYGYRLQEDSLSITLINSATAPDPYPERGIHHINLWLGVCGQDAASLMAMTDDACHPLLYQPGNVHDGVLPANGGLVSMSSDHAVITSVQPVADGLLIRGIETAGQDGQANITVNASVKGATLCDLSESGETASASVNGSTVTVPLRAYGIWQVIVNCDE